MKRGSLTMSENLLIDIREGLTLAKHKVEFLLSHGFERTYQSEEPFVYNEKTISMEKWERWENQSVDYLYIHFYKGPNTSSYCELYHGENDTECDTFSERNLISQIKKG